MASGFCDFCGIWHSGSCCHPGRARLDRAEQDNARPRAALALRNADEYHEGCGECLFFHFEAFDEPPDVCCGSPLDTGWEHDYWTHFVRFDFNAVIEQAAKLAGEVPK